MRNKEQISAFARAVIAKSSKGQYPLTEGLGEKRKEQLEEQPEELGTIAELQQTFGAAASGIAAGLHNEYDRIAKEEQIDENSPLYRHMTDEQKRSALREHREQLARQARADAVERYTQVIGERNEKLLERKRQAEAELYGGEHNSEVLARLATGSDEQVLAAARLARRTNNKKLWRAALAAAQERKLGEALIEVLDDNERSLLNELSEAPDQEALECVADADRVLPGVDINRIMPAEDGTS